MKSFYFPRRFLMISVTFLLAMIVFVYGASLITGKESIVKDPGLTNTLMGCVFSVFALCHTPSGILADRFSPGRILTVVVTVWSLLIYLRGTARHFISLLIIRFLFGADEAGAFPGMTGAISSRPPMKEGEIATGKENTGVKGIGIVYPDATGERKDLQIVVDISAVHIQRERLK